MTPKEMLYVDDALSRAKFMAAQCRAAAGQLKDTALQQEAQRLADYHTRIYTKFYNIV